MIRWLDLLRPLVGLKREFVPCICWRGDKSEPDCHTAGKTYKCAGCGRIVPWCVGAADEMPDHCDDCWAAAQEKKDVA